MGARVPPGTIPRVHRVGATSARHPDPHFPPGGPRPRQPPRRSPSGKQQSWNKTPGTLWPSPPPEGPRPRCVRTSDRPRAAHLAAAAAALQGVAGGRLSAATDGRPSGQEAGEWAAPSAALLWAPRRVRPAGVFGSWVGRAAARWGPGAGLRETRRAGAGGGRKRDERGGGRAEDTRFLRAASAGPRGQSSRSALGLLGPSASRSHECAGRGDPGDAACRLGVLGAGLQPPAAVGPPGPPPAPSAAEFAFAVL
ncbi:bcl-2-binding component 3, isoforms 3/4-like [Lutra lutra]|uniref:bcl-2-binding component 3, isoforms 3/4-like n=1 Tax=Lutra lutra TaxID=9657 RepID=UPI001FD269A5|nr:bcl-2-binding component 3, isoforms 3/4-like [Lutra lutra]